MQLSVSVNASYPPRNKQLVALSIPSRRCVDPQFAICIRASFERDALDLHSIGKPNDMVEELILFFPAIHKHCRVRGKRQISPWVVEASEDSLRLIGSNVVINNIPPALAKNKVLGCPFYERNQINRYNV